MHEFQTSFESLFDVLSNAEAQGQNTYFKEHITWIVDPVVKTKFMLGKDSTYENQWMVSSTSSSVYTGTSRSPLINTIFSDEFLATWQPTFSIRHPALVLPSFLRSMQDMPGDWDIDSVVRGCTLRFSRTLYDWYTSHLPKPTNSFSPIILDADDIILQPEYLREYSDLVGLDPGKLRFEWE